MFAALLGLVIFHTAMSAPQTLPSSFGSRVILRAQINGHTEWLHFDTGADGIFLDAGAAARDGLVKTTRHTATADIAIGALAANAAPVDLLPNYGYDDGGVHVSGAIGEPLLDSVPITIDYRNAKVTAYPNGSLDASSLGVRIPIGAYHDSMLVHVWFGDVRATMLLDSGDADTLLFSRLAGTAIVGPALPGDAVGLEGIDGTLRAGKEYRTKPMSFAGVLFNAMHVFVPSDSSWKPADDAYDGILGRDVLHLFRMTIDKASTTIYLQYAY